MKNHPRPFFLLHQMLQLALCIAADTFSWYPPNPTVSSVTPLQPTIGIAHDDLQLVCSSSAMETHFKKLPTSSSCADVASRGSLELGSECCNPRTGDFYALQHSAVAKSTHLKEGPHPFVYIVYRFIKTTQAKTMLQTNKYNFMKTWTYSCWMESKEASLLKTTSIWHIPPWIMWVSC